MRRYGRALFRARMASARTARSLKARSGVFRRPHPASVLNRPSRSASEDATVAYEGARERIADFINVPDPATVIFVRNTTEALNLVAHSWGRTHIFEGDEILLTEMEHHSNIVPWQLLAQEKRAKIRYIPITENGLLDLSDLSNLLTERTKLVSFAAMSNVFGTINPVF